MENSKIIDLFFNDNINNNIKINNFCKNNNISQESVVYMEMIKSLEKMNESMCISNKKYIKYIGSHVNYNDDFIVINLFCL